MSCAFWVEASGQSCSHASLNRWGSVETWPNSSVVVHATAARAIGPYSNHTIILGNRSSDFFDGDENNMIIGEEHQACLVDLMDLPKNNDDMEFYDHAEHQAFLVDPRGFDEFDQTDQKFDIFTGK